METNTNTNAAAWPMRIELRSPDSWAAAVFGIDANRENGDAVGWRMLEGRWIEVDSADDAEDVADYIVRDSFALGEASGARRAVMRDDADRIGRMAANRARIERAADRGGDA